MRHSNLKREREEPIRLEASGYVGRYAGFSQKQDKVFQGRERDGLGQRLHTGQEKCELWKEKSFGFSNMEVISDIDSNSFHGVMG